MDGIIKGKYLATSIKPKTLFYKKKQLLTTSKNYGV